MKTVKCIYKTKNLTFGREYQVEGHTNKAAYLIRGDDGVLRAYNRNRFHTVPCEHNLDVVDTIQNNDFSMTVISVCLNCGEESEEVVY